MHTVFNNLTDRFDDFMIELIIWKSIQLSERQHHDKL